MDEVRFRALKLELIHACINHAASLLGFDDFIPPYANAGDQALLTGVNFASAAAGIREETGQQLVYIRLRQFLLIDARSALND